MPFSHPPRSKSTLPPVVGGLGEALAAALILTSACPACVGETSVAGVPLRSLAPVGVAVGLGFALSSRFPKLRGAFDALALVQGMAGVAILALAASRGAAPCALCLALWASAFLLAGNALVRLSPHAPVRLLVGSWAAAFAVLSLSPIGRGELAKWASVPSRPAHRIAKGADTTLADGLHGFVTDCPPCALQTFIPAFRRARERGERPTLHAIAPSPELGKMFGGIRLNVESLEEYERFGVAPKGDPILVRVAAGRVVASGRAEDVR